MDGRKKNMNGIDITKEMVKNGYNKGIISVIDDGEIYGCDGVCCQIGDNAFYFDPFQTEEAESVEEYLNKNGIEYAIDEIFNTLNECIKVDFEDEYVYYYLVLKENGV